VGILDGFMNIKQIKITLIKEKPLLIKKFHVKTIGVFGSYAREEQTAKSDIDILVEFSKPVGWEFIDLKEHLEKMYGKKIDLVTVKALKPQIKKNILSETQYA